MVQGADYPEDPLFIDKRKRITSTDTKKKPVWCVMTEPQRGSLTKSDGTVEFSFDEYIPVSHIRFIEQMGAQVVAFSYKKTRMDIYALLD